jgi:hypothetical protein
VDAYSEISRLEGALRDLVRLVLGSDWITTSGFDAETIAGIEARRAEDHVRRRGARLDGDLLDYTELTQLGRVITRNWSAFDKAIGPRKYFEMDLNRLGGIRNPVAHTRQLLPFEEHLAAGISGHLRNRIAAFRSDMNEPEKYWPTLESIVDSFGNRSQGSAGEFIPPGPAIPVGEVVTFRCRATDPQGATLRWTLGSRGSTGEAEGEDVTLTWQAGPDDIGERTSVIIRLVADRPHHRYDGQSDAFVYFSYTVLP